MIPKEGGPRLTLRNMSFFFTTKKLKFFVGRKAERAPVTRYLWKSRAFLTSRGPTGGNKLRNTKISL